MVLQLEGLKVDYRSSSGVVHAVDGADFAVPEGQIVGLVGESGCGKTTMARAVTGVLASNARIVGGRMLFRGRDLLGLTPRAWRALRWRDIGGSHVGGLKDEDHAVKVGDVLIKGLHFAGRAGGGVQDEPVKIIPGHHALKQLPGSVYLPLLIPQHRWGLPEVAVNNILRTVGAHDFKHELPRPIHSIFFSDDDYVNENEEVQDVRGDL